MSEKSPEYQQECQQVVAKAALSAAEDMPFTERVMLFQGMVCLFAEGSPEKAQAEATAKSFEMADRNQLRLSTLLNPSALTPEH